MTDFFYRTEDINPARVLDYFVETEQDRRVLTQLKGRNPTVLVGSRGVGKSFLIRVAQQELLSEFDKNRVLPIYISFVRSSLLRTADPQQFRNWMLARICSSVLAAVKKQGLLPSHSASAKLLAGGDLNPDFTTKLDSIILQYENSWKNPGQAVDADSLPAIEDVKTALEDLATETNIDRFSILIDEAAHIFIPSQQRQFFTLFRDLRTHCVTCNAAVYPGVTSFGDTFQPSHDATMVSINRDVLDEDYVKSMREIVEKQADSALLKRIAQNRKNFAILAFSASGNPRLLLKTVFAASEMNSSSINGVIREYYRTEVWSEHSALAERYQGHKPIIDWGRNFIEDLVLPDMKAKNDVNLREEKNTSSFLWIHRDAPEIVKEALRVLCYTGVLTEHASGIKATRAEIGVRYIVNLGCLFALESTPAASAFEIARALTPRRMTEFGANNTAYGSFKERDIPNQDEGFDLKQQLEKQNSVLDITHYQRQKLNELELFTVGSVLEATEAKLKEAYYIGDVRARQMRNAAVASVLEYLSG